MLYLAQSDTTIGFLCKDPQKINTIKCRNNQKVLLEVDSLQTLKHFVRVPQKYKNFVRRGNKITLIYPNTKAIRVIKDPLHLRFLSPFQWFYSSSANETQKSYNPSFATSKAGVIIQDCRGLFEGQPSKMYKINSISCQRIR